MKTRAQVELKEERKKKLEKWRNYVKDVLMESKGSISHFLTHTNYSVKVT